MTNYLNEQIDKHPCEQDIWIDDVNYRMQHVIDTSHTQHNIYTSLMNGKVFDFFALTHWLHDKQTIARKFVALRVVQFCSQDKHFFQKITDKTIEHIKRIANNECGRLKQHAYAALNAIKGENIKLTGLCGKKTTDDDPLESLHFNGGNDYLTLNGKTIQKGSVGKLFINIQKLDQLMQNDPQYQHALTELMSTLPHLQNLGFFDFFSEAFEWQEASKTHPAMNIAYRNVHQKLGESI